MPVVIRPSDILQHNDNEHTMMAKTEWKMTKKLWLINGAVMFT